MNQIHIWHCSVPARELDKSCLSPEELNKASSFGFPEHRRRYAATRLMVRNLLSQYAPIDPGDWSFVSNEFGKPRIDPVQCVGLYFNISHTVSTVICAIASFPEIGVDVENRIPDEYRELAKQYYSDAERNWLQQATKETDACWRFLTIWTLKEAYIKAVGKGLSIPLTSFSIVPRDQGDATLVELDDESHDSDWCFQRFVVNNAPVAVAHPRSSPLPECQLVEYKL